jgi:hypothetical protein
MVPTGVKFQKIKSKMMAARARVETQESVFNGYRVSGGKDDKVLEMEGGDDFIVMLMGFSN